MASFNRVILVGNLTRNPELRTLQSGTSVTEIGLAVNDRRKTQAGEWVDDVTYVEVSLWGRTAEVAAQYLTKGSPCLVEGRLKYDQWETPNGEKRSKLKVIAEKMQMLGRKSDGNIDDDEGGYSGSYQRPQRGGNSYQQSHSKPQQPATPQDYYDAEPGGGDVPF